MGRRDDLADAGVRLVARSGIRSLTHRAVDVEAGVPAGSTTYYARSRRELTALVVARITQQLEEDLRDLAVPAVLDDAAAVDAALAMLGRLAARADAQAVRLALLSELRDDRDLRARRGPRGPRRRPPPLPRGRRGADRPRARARRLRRRAPPRVTARPPDAGPGSAYR
ncbi:TetR/AcrR family transcriptional regulator [Clavibacter michiganensis]|nr:hypothetical protein [Clavibacter michiganensis]AWF99632.1 hypothetical protein BEH61_14080 [Clavibacter michiganensis subsp. insidiosus]AWG00248.1 hypothetical protein BEH62_01375 [Clavibacter michiganensis subsp. insidiosus]